MDTALAVPVRQAAARALSLSSGMRKCVQKSPAHGVRLTRMKPDHRRGDDGGVLLDEAKPALKRPPLYKVVLLNDDYTPMEFVVQVLEQFFGMDRSQATQVMLHVHMKGKGVCGVFTHEVAETKVVLVTDFSRHHQHPLLCTLEEA